MNLTGSVALVTGANRGLGARLVTELLRAGVGEPQVAIAGADAQIVGEVWMAPDPSIGPAEAGHHVRNQPLKRRQSMPYLRTR